MLRVRPLHDTSGMLIVIFSSPGIILLLFSPLQTGNVVKEHRIRYLCFLGIARDDRFCGYVLDSGDRKGEKCFRFYGFRMEPNTDRLCLALHAACQARYKRVQEASSRQQNSQVRGMCLVK